MYNVQCTKYKVQSTKYKVQSTKYKVQSTKYKVQSTKYKVQSTKYKVQSTKYKVQSTKYKVQSTKYKVQSTKYKVQSTMYKVQCTRYNVEHIQKQEGPHTGFTLPQALAVLFLVLNTLHLCERLHRITVDVGTVCAEVFDEMRHVMSFLRTEKEREKRPVLLLQVLSERTQGVSLCRNSFFVLCSSVMEMREWCCP